MAQVLVQKHVYQDQGSDQNEFQEHTHATGSFATLCLRSGTMITTTSRSLGPCTKRRDDKHSATTHV